MKSEISYFCVVTNKINKDKFATTQIIRLVAVHVVAMMFSPSSHVVQPPNEHSDTDH